MAYRSITLLPGESYVIPSGATIIGATNQGLLTSQNDCANFDNVEQFACYALVLTGDEHNLSWDSPWMVGTIIYSYKIGGVEYFTGSNTNIIGSAGEVQLGGLKTNIEANTQVSGLFLDITIADYQTNDAEGGIGSICFKTLPSIGDTMTVTIKSILQDIASPFLELKVHPIDYYGGSGAFSGMCTCVVEPD